MRWLKTDGGTEFLAAGPDAYVFMVPVTDEYVVAWCGAKRGEAFDRFVCCNTIPQRWCLCGYKQARSQGIHSAHTVEMFARAMAEELAMSMGGTPFDGGEWRELPPTHVQVSYARSLGITVPKHVTPAGASVPGINGGDLGDLITVTVATQRIDGLASVVAANHNKVTT